MPLSTDKYAGLYTALLAGSQYIVTVRAWWLPLFLFLSFLLEQETRPDPSLVP